MPPKMWGFFAIFAKIPLAPPWNWPAGRLVKIETIKIISFLHNLKTLNERISEWASFFKFDQVVPKIF